MAVQKILPQGSVAAKAHDKKELTTNVRDETGKEKRLFMFELGAGFDTLDDKDRNCRETA